jgi:hypothetical protein
VRLNLHLGLCFWTIKMKLFSGTALALLPLTLAHSWIEQMSVISDNGSYTGSYGYPRGYVVRDDAVMTVLAPPNGQGRVRIDDTDVVCTKAQAQTNSNTPGWPQLETQPGDYIAAKYLENGHVTSAQNQVGKPGSGGLIYIYATTNTANPKIMDIVQWTPSGTLAQGRLLAINTFDDGRCYQINPNSALSKARQVQFPDPITGQDASHEQWCETNFQIPSDAAAGNLVLYWLWQWPTLPNRDPNDAAGKDEFYSTCADVTIGGTGPKLKARDATAQNIDPAQDPQTKAVSNYKERAANVTFPADPAFYGPKGNAVSSLLTLTASSATSASAVAPIVAPSAAPGVASDSGSGQQTSATPAPLVITVTVTATPSGSGVSLPAAQSTGLTSEMATPSPAKSTSYTTEQVTVTLPLPSGKSVSYTTEQVTVTLPSPSGMSISYTTEMVTQTLPLPSGKSVSYTTEMVTVTVPSPSANGLSIEYTTQMVTVTMPSPTMKRRHWDLRDFV